MTVLNDLLEKKGGIYSDRPTFAFCGQMIGWENTLALQHYGERFRWYRKNIHAIIGTKAAISKFYDLQITEAKRFLRGLSLSPKHFVEHIRTYVFFPLFLVYPLL